MLCKANNCPCRAEFITHWNEDRSPKWGVCRYHRHAHPDDWTTTTARVNEYKQWIAFSAMFQHAEKNPLFAPQPGETVAAWRDRIESQLRDLILGKESDGFEAFKEVIARLSQ